MIKQSKADSLKESKRPRGRPRAKDPAKTYAGKSYVVTTFRLSKQAVAQANVIADALGLSTRTAAVQFAINQCWKALPMLSSMSGDEIKTAFQRHLEDLGGTEP